MPTMSPPRPKKSRKLSRPATYKIKFKSAWIKEYPFITSIPGDACRYYLISIIIAALLI